MMNMHLSERMKNKLSSDAMVFLAWKVKIRLEYTLRHISLLTSRCWLCSKRIFGLWYPLWPACDYWDPGGFCMKNGFSSCWGEGLPLCKECDQREAGGIYLLDACMEFWPEEEQDDYEQWMDEYPEF